MAYQVDCLSTQECASIVSRLKSSDVEMDLRNFIEDLVENSTSTSFAELNRDILESLLSSGNDKKLRNAVYRQLQKTRNTKSSAQKEPISYIQRAQTNWEKRILKSVNTMCTETSLSLSKKRADKDQKEFASRWSELGTMELDVSAVRPVYGPKDFLDVLIGIQASNVVDDPTSHHWGLIQVPIETKTLNQLRVQYSEMSINQSQNGIDDVVEVPQELFANERMKLGKKVLAANLSPIALEYSKKGCPTSLRRQLWQLMLGIEVSQQDRLRYEQLKACVIEHDMLIDLLHYKDIKLTATNDDQYFVFEDYIFQVLLPFSHDTTILEHFDYTSSSPAKSYIRGKLGQEEFAVKYPPNGVIPFHGFAMLVAPLCYLYDDVHELYYVFCEMYVRYFYNLHTISSDQQSILGLCILFESLLQSQEPQLFHYMRSKDIQPLRIVFKWLMRAYSGFLSSADVLLLWDKVLAYNSLEILAVLAVAILSFRKTNLLEVSTQAAAESVVADLTTIRVMPLIQLSLFSK